MDARPVLNVKRKKRYLFTNEDVPRRTRYRRRKTNPRQNNGLSQEEMEDIGQPSSSSVTYPVDNSFPPLQMCNGSYNMFDHNGCSDSEECTQSLSENGSIGEGDSNVSEGVSGDEGREAIPTISPTPSENGSHSSINNQGDGCYDTLNDTLNISVNDSLHTGVSINRSEVLLANTLCKCSPTTEGDVLLMCLALGIRHSLTWIAMVDILKMINTIYGHEAVHASKYYLQKFLEVGEDSTKFHIYCPKCEAYIGLREEIESRELLSCQCGEKVPNFDRNTSYFLSVDMEKQFKKLLELPEVSDEILTYRFKRSKINPDAYEDIYDGAVYKKLSTPGSVLADPLNFSYTFSTDGVSLGKSTSTSVWPIYAYISELSPKLRRKHMLFAGVWVGQKDPNMRLFLKPFVDLANRLSTEGVKWKDQTGAEQVSKIIPLCCVCDSGARYKLLNMSSFSAYYGCTFCYHRAENTNKGRRFTVTTEPARDRTQDSMLRDMNQAFQNRNNKNKKQRIVFGQKGPTPLVQLLNVDLSEAFVVDFMHSVLLGNVRSHVFIFLESAGQVDYYIGAPKSQHIIDQRLLKIQPPKSITRHPRALKHVKYWKASEWRSFILYYSIICLKDQIQADYLAHLAFLSSAMYILLKKSITVEEIKTAEKYLLKYVYYIELYFGKTAMLYNVHLLLHIIKGVYNWGPLWTHNAFDFEGNNHKLVQMYTSPGFVAQQLTKRYLIFNSLPTLCEKYASTDYPLDYIKEITGKGLKSFFRCGDTVLLGNGKPFKPGDDSEEASLLLSNNIDVNNITGFSKFVSGGLRFTTAEYSTGKKNDDSYVAIDYTRVRIEKILYTVSTGGTHVVLLVRELVLHETPILKTSDIVVTHIKRVLCTGALIAVKPSQITNQCLYMATDTGKYIADIPFGSYHD